MVHIGGGTFANSQAFPRPSRGPTPWCFIVGPLIRQIGQEEYAGSFATSLDRLAFGLTYEGPVAVTAVTTVTTGATVSTNYNPNEVHLHQVTAVTAD